jgi:hypothetical protein
MRLIFAAVIAGIIFVVGCNTTGVPTEFANACGQDLDGKTLEVSGILNPRTAIFCSNRGGRMECPFELTDTAGGGKYITADIEVGSGANTVDEIPKGFKKEDLKVRDNAGSPVALGTDKVKVTGKMAIAPAAPGGQGVCLMQVYKIEK